MKTLPIIRFTTIALYLVLACFVIFGAFTITMNAMSREWVNVAFAIFGILIFVFVWLIITGFWAVACNILKELQIINLKTKAEIRL